MVDRKLLEYIRTLTANAEETVRFLSNDRKPERERSVCATFLRCLGVNFAVEDLVPAGEGKDPPDVIFDAARFEVLEVLDEGRRRHDESKSRVERLKRAKTIEDVEVPFISPEPLTYAEVLDLIAMALTKKASRYGAKVCAELYALVYVDLSHKFLAPNSALHSHPTLLNQGWRSISFVMPPL